MSARFYSDDEEEDISNEVPYEKIAGRDSVVFAIECNMEMFEIENDESPFSRLIDAIYELYLNKIITSDKDLHGIMFYGTRENRNSSDFSGIYEWLQFDVPCIKSITELKNMKDCTAFKFEAEYGMQKDYHISDVLWNCLNMFSKTSFSLASKTLLLFSWNDDPHPNDDNSRKRAKAKATDLHDHNVDVQVLSFNPKFSYDHFFKDITSDPENPEPEFDNPIHCVQNLYSFLLRKCSKQRPLTRIQLKLGNDVNLSVGVYTVTRRASKSNYVTIDATTNEEVSRKNHFLDANTGEILMPSDIKLLQKWGGRDLVFEKEEVQQMKRIVKRGLHLLGFKPRKQAVKAWYHVRNAQFIYPDEKTIAGSSTLFSALLKKCLEKDVVAICSYAPRENSPPKCVALLPQNEEIDSETSQQILPPGFYIIFLPFADDIRKLDIEKHFCEPSSAQVEAAEAMIRRLRFQFDPENFDNPVIQTHYKSLEAMALEKADREIVEDHTVPDNQAIEDKAGAQIDFFKQICGLNDVSRKRGADGSSGDSGSKKAKENIEIDVKEYVSQNKLEKLTVQSLKEICRTYGIKSTGKKNDIIIAIKNYFD